MAEDFQAVLREDMYCRVLKKKGDLVSGPAAWSLS